MVFWGGFTNSWEKERSKRQRRRGNIYQSDAEFQRIARRDKKALLSEQCKEIEENNTKTRDCFKKIKRYNGTISCKDGHNEGQKWYGLNKSRRY